MLTYTAPRAHDLSLNYPITPALAYSPTITEPNPNTAAIRPISWDQFECLNPLQWTSIICQQVMIKVKHKSTEFCERRLTKKGVLALMSRGEPYSANLHHLHNTDESEIPPGPSAAVQEKTKFWKTIASTAIRLISCQTTLRNKPA